MATRNTKRDDRTRALVIAALKRAIAVVEGSMSDKSTKPEEGAYPVDFDVTIAGDIAVGAASPGGDPREVQTLSAGEVLAGILATTRRSADRARMLARGIEAAVAGKGDKAWDEQVKAMETVTLDACREAGAVEQRPTPRRAGAVTGKPTVTIDGTHGESIVSVEVTAA